MRYIEVTIILECPDNVDGSMLLRAIQQAVRTPLPLFGCEGMITNVDEIHASDIHDNELEERFEQLREQGNIAHAMNYDITKK